jgi:hypothetical protein
MACEATRWIGRAEAEGTVRIGLDSAAYEIDLNAEHARALQDALSRYVQGARQAGSGARRSARGGQTVRADGVDSSEVREWAKTQGIGVKDRGRVPAELVVMFKAATTRQVRRIPVFSHGPLTHMPMSECPAARVRGAPERMGTVWECLGLHDYPCLDRPVLYT